jgi:transcriptional regulator with XRE-family HTH domain
LATNSTRHTKQKLTQTDVGQQLASIRLRAGMTQSQIANELDISRQHVSNIETGFTSPTLDVLEKYLKACGADLDSFFCGPLPKYQTPHQREYHRKLQDILESRSLSAAITKVLDAFHSSVQTAASAAVQPPRVQARRKSGGT